MRIRRGISLLRDGKKRRPFGRNDRFWVVDRVREANFGEVESLQDNRLKQKTMRSPATG
jgi:hypothetical protein